MNNEGVADAFIAALHQPSALLPITKYRNTILYLLERSPVLIVVGQTGSGKTTQIPQYLEQAGWCSDGKIVAITQPRRVAATTIATRVAEEMGCKLGQEVGYSIRFEDVTSEATKIKFMTDGLLLREALVDPLLSRYSVIMIDEAHEQSLSSEILLGVLKKIRKRRPDLRVIISSATLQAQDFLDFFTSDTGGSKVANNATEAEIGHIVSVEGRMYPVDIHYLVSPAESYVEKTVQIIFEINDQEDNGDILVFLTGREEIDTCIQMIADRLPTIPRGKPSLYPLPLYAGLPTEQQMYIFEEPPENTRKVIISTNIAEASITIPGIVYVVDCGFVKLRAYNPVTGIETLTAVDISKAAATQRAGRAGRIKPGKCYRLFTELAFNSMMEASIPEIQRSNLAPMILQLKCLGIDNVARFPYFTPPPSTLVVRALEILSSLGALDEYARLTKPLGIRMAELAAIEPMMAKVLLTSVDFGCLGEMLSIAAMTTLQGAIWVQHDGDKKAAETSRWRFAVDEGDHLTLLNVYQAFITKGKKDSSWCRNNMLNFKSLTRAVSIRNQLKRYLERFGIAVDETLSRAGSGNRPNSGEQIRRCLTTGFFANAARMQPDGSFKTVDGATTLYAHPTSLMFNRKADWVIFHEVIQTSNKTFIRDITKIEKAWLTEYAPQYYSIGGSITHASKHICYHPHHNLWIEHASTNKETIACTTNDIEATSPMDVQCNGQIRSSQIAGNGIFTDQAVTAGETITRLDRPLIGILDLKNVDTTCANCFWVTTADYDGPRTVSACTGCRKVRYCSRACQRESWKRIHKYECKIYKEKPGPLPCLVRAAFQCLLLLQYGTEEEKRSITRMSTFISEQHRQQQDVLFAIRLTLGLIKEDSHGKDVPEGLVQEAVTMLMVNAFTLIQDTLEPLGIAFDPFISTANHSCAANAVVIFDGAQVSLRSLRSIAKGEEVFQAYIDVNDDVSIRQQRLKDVYSFACHCSKCETEQKALVKGTVTSSEALQKHFDKAYHESQPKLATAMLRDIIKTAAMDKDFPDTRQPIPNSYQALLSKTNASGDFKISLRIAAKQYFRLDPVLHPTRFHVVRVVHTWTLVKLLLYLDSSYKEQGAIEQIRADFGVDDFLIPIWRLLAQLKEDVMKSHGPSRFAAMIMARAREMESEIAAGGPQVSAFIAQDPMSHWKAFESMAKRPLDFDTNTLK